MVHVYVCVYVRRDKLRCSRADMGQIVSQFRYERGWFSRRSSIGTRDLSRGRG